ncbi:hypothetical protein ACU4GR_00840 [Methylobacterium oryzae CBMB20]
MCLAVDHRADLARRLDQVVALAGPGDLQPELVHVALAVEVGGELGALQRRDLLQDQRQVEIVGSVDRAEDLEAHGAINLGLGAAGRVRLRHGCLSGVDGSE